MKLVKGEPKDARILKNIHVRAYQKCYRGFLPDEYLDSLVVNDDIVERTARHIEKTECYFVELDSKKVAFVYLDYPKENEQQFEIMAIYVHPDNQKKGVGRFLIDELTQMKKKEGFKQVIAWTIKEGPSVGFYEKAGFKQVDGKSNFWKFDIPLVCFMKDL